MIVRAVLLSPGGRQEGWIMRARSPHAHRATLLSLATVALLAIPSPVRASVACDPTGVDAAPVEAARAVVQATCDCAGASGVKEWRTCVRVTVASLGDVRLSDSCRRHVRRLEMRSLCGRSDRVVCCQTSAVGRKRVTVRRPAHCTAPSGGSSCETEAPYLDGACREEGCASPDTCGNGVVDPGESCDPPDGTTCSATCTRCAPASPGELLLGCTSGSTGVDASAVPSALLVAYTRAARGGFDQAVARRIGNDGSIVDAKPLVVSGPFPTATVVGGFAEAATSDGSDFYVGWSAWQEYYSYFGGRRVPAVGAIASAPEILASELGFGYCRASMVGPLELAPRLGAGFRATWSVIYGCGGEIYFRALAGVGPFFTVPPPGNVSSGAAPIVRGTSDVAAVWWNVYASSLQPLVTDRFLAASWVEPGPASMIRLGPGSSPVSPALAAIGDTFVAVWAQGDEIRAMRFTRAAGPLDPGGGILVATGAGEIDDVAAASDGATVLVAWSERAGTGRSAIRAIRVAADGTVPDPTPIEVATSTAGAAVSAAANPSAALVAFTRSEPVGSSVRAVRLGP